MEAKEQASIYKRDNILKEKFKMLWETVTGGPNLSVEVRKYSLEEVVFQLIPKC